MQLKSRYLAVVCFILVVKTHNFSSPNFWNGSTEVNHFIASGVLGSQHSLQSLQCYRWRNSCWGDPKFSMGTVTPVYLEASREVRVSINGATPKSSTLIGFFQQINHPFWGTPHLWKPPSVFLQHLYPLAFKTRRHRLESCSGPCRVCWS